jgi:hypothetical protein
MVQLHKMVLSIDGTLFLLLLDGFLLLPPVFLPFIVFLVHLLLALTACLHCLDAQLLVSHQVASYPCVFLLQKLVVCLQRWRKQDLQTGEGNLQIIVFFQSSFQPLGSFLDIGLQGSQSSIFFLGSIDKFLVLIVE